MSTIALVTGATGFLGTRLVATLRRRGTLVIPVHAGMKTVPEAPRCEVLFCNLITVLRAFRVDVVFHLAGSGTPCDDSACPHKHEWANVATTRAVTDAILATGYSGRLIFSSSASVYGNTGGRRMTEDDALDPCTDYGRTKMEAEACLLKRLRNKCTVKIARVFHLFGPGQRKLVVYDLCSRIVAGERPLIVRGTGHEARDFVFVEDVVRILMLLGLDADDAASEIINVCSGVSTKICEVASVLLYLDRRPKHDFRLTPVLAINPVIACVGNPGKLAKRGVAVSLPSEAHLGKTLSWVKTSHLE